MCDGEEDCPDGSDENAAHCAGQIKPPTGQQPSTQTTGQTPSPRKSKGQPQQRPYPTNAFGLRPTKAPGQAKRDSPNKHTIRTNPRNVKQDKADTHIHSADKIVFPPEKSNDSNSEELKNSENESDTNDKSNNFGTSYNNNANKNDAIGKIDNNTTILSSSCNSCAMNNGGCHQVKLSHPYP